MIRRPPRSTLSSSSAASDVYKRQALCRLWVQDHRRYRSTYPRLQRRNVIPPRGRGARFEPVEVDGVHTNLPAAVSDRYHGVVSVSYTHLRAHETPEHLVCRLLLEKKNTTTT